LECYRDRAGIASLSPEPVAVRDAALVHASAAAQAAALAQARSDGQIGITIEGVSRRFPAGSRALTPGLYLHGWGAALVVRDRAALSALCDGATIDAVAWSTTRMDPFWRITFSAFATLVLSPSLFVELAGEARAAIARTADPIIEPGYIAHLIEPLLAMGEAVAHNDRAGWNRTLVDAVTRHRDWYGRGPRRNDPAGLLAFAILGITALAHDRGLESEIDSEYIPLDLVRTRPTSSAPAVRYIYPVRKLHRPDEANWFLDLEGFPRAGRRHMIVQRGDRLLARYEVSGAPGVPDAVADFEIAPEHPEKREASTEDALDPAELVMAADLLARRGQLAEAIEAIEDARDRLASAGEQSVQMLFHSARGMAAWRAEPGRFTPDRLDAVAKAWKVRLEAPMKETAFASVALICAQVEPILRTIAIDRTGEAIKLLRPRDDDYEKVFSGAAVELARRFYEKLWSEPMDLAYPAPAQTQLRCFACPAGLLDQENELSRTFPEAYRHIARWLNPHRVWVAWKYTAPGQTSGLAYNGLVWCDDHWAWYPKPNRALAELR
jgi:hypothetical protein